MNDFDEAVRLGQGRHTHRESGSSIVSNVLGGSTSGGHGLVSLPGSVNPKPKNETLEPDTVPRPEVPGWPSLQSRQATSRGMPWQVGEPEHPSPSHNPRQMSRLGLPSSNVISSTILEQDLESDSLSAIENPQTVPEKAGKSEKQKSTQQNPKMIRVATSTSCIPQTAASGPKARNPLNIKRARSNSDVYGKATPTKQLPHTKLKGKLSGPETRGAKGAAGVSSILKPSPGAHTRASPSRLTQVPRSDGDPKKLPDSRAFSSSSGRGRGAEEGHKSSKSSQNSQAEGQYIIVYSRIP